MTASELTVEAIESMPAGREMDRLVAETVMGQVWDGGNPIKNYDGRWPWPPPYSTDIAAAWEVAEWLRKWYGQFSLVAGLQWHCMHEEMKPDWGSGETMPLAVCRAALLTVLKKVANR